MAKTNLFHVQETVLVANGFTKEVLNDKNGPNDTINTVRFEYYTMRISEDIAIEVSYTYLTEDEKQYKLHSSAIELNVDDTRVSIPIKKLSSLLNLILILKGDD